MSFFRAPVNRMNSISAASENYKPHRAEYPFLLFMLASEQTYIEYFDECNSCAKGNSETQRFSLLINALRSLIRWCISAVDFVAMCDAMRCSMGFFILSTKIIWPIDLLYIEISSDSASARMSGWRAVAVVSASRGSCACAWEILSRWVMVIDLSILCGSSYPYTKRREWSLVWHLRSCGNIKWIRCWISSVRDPL